MPTHDSYPWLADKRARHPEVTAAYKRGRRDGSRLTLVLAAIAAAGALAYSDVTASGKTGASRAPSPAPSHALHARGKHPRTGRHRG